MELEDLEAKSWGDERGMEKGRRKRPGEEDLDCCDEKFPECQDPRALPRDKPLGQQHTIDQGLYLSISTIQGRPCFHYYVYELYSSIMLYNAHRDCADSTAPFSRAELQEQAASRRKPNMVNFFHSICI